MSYVELILDSASPQRALAVIGQGIDEILEKLSNLEMAETVDGWGEWQSNAGAVMGEPAQAATIKRDTDEAVVELAPASPERQEQRRQFSENVLRLHLALPELGEEVHDFYAKGGPMWLYHGNRDLVMSYDQSVRSLLVQDIEQDSHEQAHEVGRDILKDPESQQMSADSLPGVWT